MATYDPLNLDYMDPYAVQILTDSIFERIGNMIVDEISSDEHLNDNNHIPSSLAVYKYLNNISSSGSSGITNVTAITNIGTQIANINGTLIYNGIAESNGEELTTEKLYKIKTNSKGQIISASEATAVDIQDLLSLSLSKPDASTISLNVNGSSVSTVTDEYSGSGSDANTTYTLSKSGSNIVLTGSDGSRSSVTDSTGSSSANVVQKTTTGTAIATVDGTTIYNGVSSSTSGKGLINISNGTASTGAEGTAYVTAPSGASQYLFFIVGDDVVSGAVQTGSCSGGQSLSFSYQGNTGFRWWICMFFG